MPPPAIRLLGLVLATAAPAGAPDIRDIHGLEELTFWEQYHWHVILGGIGGLLALAFILWLVLRKQPAPPPTPVELARRELAAARLVPADQHKLFAITASDAVRRYLERAYQLPAPERTTEEFLQEMTRHAWMQGKLAELLKKFLEFCDLAKFAGQEFGAPEREQLLHAAGEFVETADNLRQPGANAGAAKPPHAAPPPHADTTAITP